ncbi:hypothetical protein [Pacificoceanicola onchidii]|uniref:hypothetical protein n=1 Tax=Pacificoceanicola onchidii TaxID=2562685 RepID=UPI0010A4D200|nr:hypothetical protein [Pacificoceanicola onchidii]
MIPHQGIPLDIPRIQAASELLSQISPDAQLIQLQNLCENNGIWTVPDDHSRYSPVLFEVSLFGVPAIADTAEDLPRNWLRAAGNILKDQPQGSGL